MQRKYPAAEGACGQARLSDEEFAVFEQMRDKTPSRPVSFE